MKKILLTFNFFVALSASSLLTAVERFPRPEFESGYQQPEIEVPEARGIPQESTDIIILAAILILASWTIHYKRSRKMTAALMVFSLMYFGFFRLGCICAIGATQNVAAAFGSAEYSPSFSAVLFFFLPLIFALFFGRVFCATACPLGAIQDIVAIKPIRIHRPFAAAMKLFPIFYLGFSIYFAFLGVGFIICRFDPFVGFFRLSATWPMFAFGSVLLVIGIFIARPYCRFLCPYGVLLKWTSAFSVKSTTVTPDECIHCRLCEKACPYDVIEYPAPKKAPEPEEKGLKRVAIMLSLIPLLAISFGWTISRAEPLLSRMHPTVRLAEEVALENAGLLKGQSIDTEAFRSKGQPLEALYAEANQTRKRFKRNGWILGIFLGLASGMTLLGHAGWGKQKNYKPDKGECLSCGRCYVSCPKEHQRLKECADA